MKSFRTGDTVNIYNQSFNGEFFFEGKARVFDRVSGESRYRVRFASEGKVLFERYVDPDPIAQSDPERYVAM